MHALAIAMTIMSFVDAGDGIRIWYNDSPANGSPIIVIHGGPGMDHLTLEADLAPLAAHHRMIYYDQRGGGRSTLPSDPSLLTIDHHVQDLEALRQHLRLDKVTLLAHSFGPAIAALVASLLRIRFAHEAFLAGSRGSRHPAAVREVNHRKGPLPIRLDRRSATGA